MEYFKDYTYLGKTHQDYIDLIELAFAENCHEKQKERRLFALSHTWENNVLEIYKAIELVQKHN